MTTVRPASVLRNPDFVRLWIAETTSQFGTQISLLTLPLVAVTLLNATPLEVAALGTIAFPEAIATVIGLRTVILVGAIGSFLALLPLVLTPVRTLRDMPTPAEDPVDPAAGADCGVAPAELAAEQDGDLLLQALGHMGVDEPG